MLYQTVEGDAKMRRLIALIGMGLVVSFYPSMLAERADASACESVWNSAHTKVVYITCPIDGEVETD
jgi:hypothetical protein